MTSETLEGYIQKARDEGFEKAWKQAGHLDLELRHRDVQIAELKAENARYRKALEFYADETNIEYGEYQNDFEMTPPYRYGAHAREALKGGE